MERKARVLGVDDSLTIRKALEIVLKPAGYELELAVDGADALAKAKSFKPDVILLDFILPDMRGSEVCQHLALDPETAHIPVILVSAKGAEIRQAYRDATNVVSYIAKPFKPQVVTSIVAEVLAKTAAGEQVKAAVPVHEAEGISVPPMPTVQPPAELFPSGLVSSPTPAAATTAPLPPQEVPPVGPSVSERPTVGISPATETPARPTPLPRPPRPARVARKAQTSEVPGEVVAPLFTSEAERREALDLMFELLRASIEGVYVEEVDTPLGAAADQAKSYIDLLDALTREVAEGMQHARSGAKYLMYSDGSVRSLEGALHEIFRRTCRLLFRATTVAGVTSEAPTNKQRVLVLCHKGGAMWRQLPALLAAHPEWQTFTISEGFRQIPMLVRLFGPSLVLAEVAPTAALWEQLHVAARLPEWSAATVIGVLSSDRPIPRDWENSEVREKALGERGIARLVTTLFEIERATEQPAPEPAEAAPGEVAQQETGAAPSDQDAAEFASSSTLGN